jgi:hypothetical protein
VIEVSGLLTNNLNLLTFFVSNVISGKIAWLGRVRAISIDDQRYIMKKRLLIIFIAALFICAFAPALAFVPALDQPADALLSKASPGFDAYAQFIALINESHNFDGQRLWLRASASLATPCRLPIALPASADFRAPPA